MSALNLIRKLPELVVTRVHKLVRIHDTPHSNAGGVAIGIFVGFTPLFFPLVPVKYSLSVLISWAFRCSKTAALIAVTAHDVIFPIWPLVLRWEFDIGFWLLHHHMPSRLHMEHRHISFDRWFSLETFHSWSQWAHDRMNWLFLAKVLGPTLIGSVIVGVPVAALSYFISLRIVNRYQAAALLKAQQSPDSP